MSVSKRHSVVVNSVEYLTKVGEMPRVYPMLYPVWRVDHERMTATTVGYVTRTSQKTYRLHLYGKTWRSLVQAMVEVAKADQGVDYAR